MKRVVAMTIPVVLAALCFSAPAFADPPPTFGPPPSHYVPPEPPMKRRSVAMMIGGGITTGIGADSVVAGGILILTCPGCDGESFGPLFLGIGLIGLGVLQAWGGHPTACRGSQQGASGPGECSAQPVMGWRARRRGLDVAILKEPGLKQR